MKKKFVVMTVAAVLGTALIVVYFFVNRERRAVESLVENFTEFVCVAPGRQPHDGALKYARIVEFFSPSVSFRSVDPDIKVDCSREDLKTMWGVYQQMVDRMEVKTEKISAEVNGEKAVFSGNVQINGVVKGGKIDFNGVYLLHGSAEKSDGKWTISSIIVEPVVK